MTNRRRSGTEAGSVMFPTCGYLCPEVATLSVMFPTGVPLRDDGAMTGECIQNPGMFESLPQEEREWMKDEQANSKKSEARMKRISNSIWYNIVNRKESE